MFRRPLRARQWLTVLAVAALAGLGLARRLSTVAEYRNFAGDGWQYFHLAENLVKNHRYAFGPPPLPPANSRLPGYPLFVALSSLRSPGFADGDVAVRVTRAQAVLDVLTALLAFLIARELSLRMPRFLALALCAASPFLALCACYVLSETLSIFLTTLTVLLLLRAARARLVTHLAWAGAVQGLGMLVRADAVTLLPCFLVPLLFSTENAAEKRRAALWAALAAALVFAPWPLRNLVRFHAPHLTGSQWVTKGGDPLPSGVQAWMRTWAVDPSSAPEVPWRMTRGTAIWLGALPAEAFDGPAERKRVGELLDAYNRTGLITPAVDGGFRALAAERRQRDPRRYYLELPLRRAKELWLNPVPEWELPVVSPTLDLPARRADLLPLTRRSLLLALAGLLLLAAWPWGRPLAALVGIAALARTGAIAFAVPGGTQRYLLELLPLLLVLASVALVAPAELILRTLARGSVRSS